MAPAQGAPRAADQEPRDCRRTHAQGTAGDRRYVALGTAAQRRAVVLVGLAWAVAAVHFWTWWLDGDHVVSVPGTVVNSLLLAFEFAILPVWFVVFARRAARPERRGPVPRLRSAMVVTKAPSEPWSVVRATLEACLDQDAGVGHDVWLADEQPTPAVRAWCAAHGVEVSTREGVEAYHQPTWPRRTRCKEGNLAFFYDHHGYDRYDVVLQFDADHVPQPDYLRLVLKAFDDPRVGYVAAPSVCDANADRSWAARGRLHLEAAMHGAAQAGANDGWAPCCIGSHYAVRTQALREAGGIGPELAEDFSTSLMISAAGWRGAFAPDAIAHGDGPETIADAVTQDLQWSQSMMSLLLEHAGPALRRTPWRARLKFAFCLAWYPLGALVLAAAHLLPVVALLLGRPIVAVDLAEFALHLGPCVAVMLLLVWTIKRAGWLRPADAPVLSWEAMLFVLVRWPWTVVGCVRAVWVRLTGRRVDWKVTPKGGTGPTAMPVSVLAPPLLIAALSAAPVLLVPDPGAARGYLFWALFNALLYLGVAVAVAALHVHEQRGALRGALEGLRLMRRPGLATVGALALVGPGVATGAPGALQAWQHERPALASLAQPWPEAPGSGGPMLGVATDALARNVAVPFDAVDLVEVDRFARAARARVGIVHLFVDFRSDPADLRRQLRLIAARGATPEVTWEPWDHRVGPHKDQEDFALRWIAAGRHDAHLRAVAREIAAFGGTVRLRFAQEMDGVAYPWSERRSGNRPGDFVAAWRHVHRVVRDEGATNARWVWAPLATTFDTRLYPGHDVVDVIGMSGFNGGAKLRWSGWKTFGELFVPAFRKAAELAPGKPIEISEVGSAEEGGDKAAWIRHMWRVLHDSPQVEAVLWFDLDKEADWRIGSSAAAQGAFAEGLAALRSLALPSAP